MIFYGIVISPFYMKINIKIGTYIKKLLRKYKKRFIILHKKNGMSVKGKGRSLFRKIKKFLYGK